MKRKKVAVAISFDNKKINFNIYLPYQLLLSMKTEINKNKSRKKIKTTSFSTIPIVLLMIEGPPLTINRLWRIPADHRQL